MVVGIQGTDLSYTLVSSDPPWWPGWRWWTNPRAAAFVDNEVLKLGYYLLGIRLAFFLKRLAALFSWLLRRLGQCGSVDSVDSRRAD